MKFEDKAALNILAKTSSSVFLMASSMVMTRFLSKEAYGTYLQAMLLLNTVTLLSFVGIGQSIFYYYPQVDNRAAFVRRNLLVGFAIGAVTAAGLFLGQGLIAHLFKDEGIIRYILFVSLLLLLQGPTNLKDPIFLSSGALVANSVLTVIGSTIDFLPLMISVILKMGLTGIFWTAVVCRLLNLLLFLAMTKMYCLRGEGSIAEKGRAVSLMDQFRYLLPLGAAGYVSTVGKQLDKYIVTSGFSAAQFALYSRGATEVPFISTITYMINDITLPRYVEAYQARDYRKLLQMMHTNIDKVAKINFSVFAFLFVEARLFIEILYTKQYVESAPIFQVYLLSLLFGVTVYNMIPTVSGKTKFLLIATVLSVCLTIVSSLLLLRILGPLGVAMGVFVGSFGYMFYLLYCSIGILSVTWREIMPWGNVLKILSAAFGSAAVVVLFHWVLALLGIDDNIVTLGFAFVIFAYCYLAGLGLLNLVCLEDREFLKRWLRFDLFTLMPWLRWNAYPAGR